MRVDEFDFELPEKNIALRPAIPRDSARLLLVNGGQVDEFENLTVSNLPGLLRKGDALIFNDTRVIPAQLQGTRDRNGVIAHLGVTLHLRTSGDTWHAFVRGSKKLAVGELVDFGAAGLKAIATEKRDAGEVVFQFNLSGPQLDAALVEAGEIPLPPYIASKRATDARDHKDYQTIYAAKDGAVAAPTAGLHFTPELFEALDRAGIERHAVTLHVGAGTFLPVKVDDTNDHKMHVESGTISAETAAALNRVRSNDGRLICVGTTSLRLLESAVEEDGTFVPWHGETDIFITPGFSFKAADALMTNFHLPRSTLFMLVSAFAGRETMRNAYQHAIDNEYRFYSYGDSSLLFPAEVKNP